VSTFPKELDKSIARRMKELGRTLFKEESDAVEGELFQSWVTAKRYDELIGRMHAIYDRDGGAEECMLLGIALQEEGDLERIDALFRGLINRRVRAFWANWEQASSGHPGHMHGCAKQAADAMEVYLEYYTRLASLGRHDDKEVLRQEMLAFQARERGGIPGKPPNKPSKPKLPRGEA
jgi:hypothetical protein